ncbi:uncharacterized protein FOBCDRAFT_228626 [Fusarium oxysporum Fo47]|uniref:uncharacterized protein n=1 Tax=Fusarium oxysporum Fo47 TaxID=660027 RepID=UPI002869C9A3|nr:uncharacterized protein FOBCDRAFT_228626 [Fusarium oxysporum Fo47]WJG35927.1 hypothetical protein FOBCDRAFT_228626 [Fusarium oxysporum Fo47]
MAPRWFRKVESKAKKLLSPSAPSPSPSPTPEPKLVEVYEKILSVRLYRKDLSSVTCELTENKIEGARKTRCCQIQQLVRDGLDRMQKAASIKQGINEGLQAVQAVRGIILLNPVTEACCNYNGIAYVLLRIEWY